MKGYKVFNPDWTCRGFQYEIGKTFKHEGEIDVCKTGFHFCEKIADCFNYYRFDSRNKVAEIEAVGNIKTDGDKSVTDEIRIIRELNWYEVLDLTNTGKNCTGLQNTGNWNSGNRNSGYYNSGNWNSGDYNSGNRNSGDYNSGNWNSGDWNSCDFSAGFFNTYEQPIYTFNKPLNISRAEFINCDGVQILRQNYENNIWVYADNMTDDEKKSHPEYECTGGYLKTVDFKTACKKMWEKLTVEEKQKVCKIPNFDKKVFKEITDIDVNEKH